MIIDLKDLSVLRVERFQNSDHHWGNFNRRYDIVFLNTKSQAFNGWKYEHVLDEVLPKIVQLKDLEYKAVFENLDRNGFKIIIQFNNDKDAFFFGLLCEADGI